MNRSTSTTGHSRAYMRNLPVHLLRALAPPRVRAAVLVAMALLSAACSDSASSLLSPSLLSSASKSPAPAASNFAVLARTRVTCTDGIIIGNVGTLVAPPVGGVTSTRCDIRGSVHVGDRAAREAFADFQRTFAALTARTCDRTLVTVELSGLTLTPGVTCFPAAVTGTSGVLTLSGNGLFLIKVGILGTGALTTTNFRVDLINGAQACNVIFLVPQATTLTTSTFQGNILAGGGITTTGGTLNGNAFSNADVTITGTRVTGCTGRRGNGNGNGDSDSDSDSDSDKGKDKCNQGVGNGPEGCDPGNSNNRKPSNDENGGTPGNPGRKP